MNAIDLTGRTAIVTGGTRGIGYACAQRLLDSSATVMIWGQDGAALESALKLLGKQHQHAAHGAIVDVSDETAVAQGVAQALGAMGKIDILVNNAGITGPNHATWDYPLSDWQRVLDVNLTGTFLCSRAVVPHMLLQGYGRIINMSSIAGKEGNPNASAYSASKAGIISLTKSMGKELATSGVLVNCVTPAATQTDLFEQMTDAHIKYMRSKIPMDRFCEPAEIAAMVAWLASEECSFTTGAVFDISGGRATY